MIKRQNDTVDVNPAYIIPSLSLNKGSFQTSGPCSAVGISPDYRDRCTGSVPILAHTSIEIDHEVVFSSPG